MRWFEFIELKLGSGGLVDSSAFIHYLGEKTGCSNFSELKIPLKVVAADFWSREQVVFEKGGLWPAVQASIAVPGLFEPVEHEGRVLFDGGLVNPVPYDLLMDDCDVVVAVDVLGMRTPDSDDGPGYFEITFNSFQILQNAIIKEKLACVEPDIYIKPAIENVRVLEFYKAEQIFREALPAATRLKSALRNKMSI